MNLKLLAYISAIILPISAQAQDSTKNYKMGEVVVTSTRMQIPLKNIPQKVEILNRSIINSSPGENLGEILKRYTNLNIIQYPGAMTTIGLRGFPATAHSRNYTLILIDGLPSGTNNLATIPSDIIESIEIVKGPYSVLYGSDAMGGVINVISRKAKNKAEGSAETGVGNFGRRNFNGYASGYITPSLLFSMSFSRQEQNSDYRIGSKNLLNISDTEINILDKKSYGDVMENSRYQLNQFNGKLEYEINKKIDVKIFSSLTASNDIETPGNYWHSYGKSKKDINRYANYGEIRYVEKNNILIISPYLSIQKESNYDGNTESAFINSSENIRQSGIRIGNTHTWNELKWLIGSDLDKYEVSSHRYSAKLTPTDPYRPDHNRQSVSAFTQLTYKLNNLFLSAGGRINFITYLMRPNEFLNNPEKESSYTNFNPSIGVKYSILPQLALRTSYGNAFYVPDAYKSAGVYKIGKKIYVGNSKLKPETVNSFDIGANFGESDIINIDLAYFQNYYKNKIVNDNSRKDTVTYKNASNGTMSGIEILFSSNIAKLWSSSYKLEFFGGATGFIKNSFKDKVKNSNGEEIIIEKASLYTRNFTANFGLVFNNYNGFEARISGRYIGNRLENDWMAWDNLRPGILAEHYYSKEGYTANDKILRHSDHLVFDMSAFYTISRNAKIGITVSNLLDENYTEKDGYNMPGRGIMGQLSLYF